MKRIIKITAYWIIAFVIIYSPYLFSRDRVLASNGHFIDLHPMEFILTLYYMITVFVFAYLFAVKIFKVEFNVILWLLDQIENTWKVRWGIDRYFYRKTKRY